MSAPPMVKWTPQLQIEWRKLESIVDECESYLNSKAMYNNGDDHLRHRTTSSKTAVKKITIPTDVVVAASNATPLIVNNDSKNETVVNSRDNTDVSNANDSEITAEITSGHKTSQFESMILQSMLQSTPEITTPEAFSTTSLLEQPSLSLSSAPIDPNTILQWQVLAKHDNQVLPNLTRIIHEHSSHLDFTSALNEAYAHYAHAGREFSYQKGLYLFRLVQESSVFQRMKLGIYLMTRSDKVHVVYSELIIDGSVLTRPETLIVLRHVPISFLDKETADKIIDDVANDDITTTAIVEDESKKKVANRHRRLGRGKKTVSTSLITDVTQSTIENSTENTTTTMIWQIALFYNRIFIPIGR